MHPETITCHEEEVNSSIKVTSETTTCALNPKPPLRLLANELNYVSLFNPLALGDNHLCTFLYFD
jgi:hypothetical protein